jgi:ABC-type branched-subunit amino acid transport system substrate-binding protein
MIDLRTQEVIVRTVPVGSRSRHSSRVSQFVRGGLIGLLSAFLATTGCAPSVGRPAGGSSEAQAAAPVRVGAVFPLHGNAAALAGEQLRGVQIAIDFANADGGIGGRPIVLDVRDLASRDDAPAVMAQLKAAGASVVVGAYSSDLSIAASEAAARVGLVYWEAGAVADQLTGRGLPMVFRVGASGTNLGSNSAAFAARVLAPRLGTTSAALRVAIVNAEDEYARSVADAAAKTADIQGTPIVARASYNLSVPDWSNLMSKLARFRPDVLILASHIPDGIAFRRAMLAAGLKVGALIGSTMAECSPDFAGDLGPDAVGIFASDRPTGGFQPSALSAPARALYDRFAAAWTRLAPAPGKGSEQGREYRGYAGVPTGSSGSAGESESEYTITGPVEEGSVSAGPSEEGLSGFSAAWVLVHDVLPSAAAHGGLEPEGVAVAARGLDLPEGALPNGAGLHFSTEPGTLGQNERAAAVIWQWQAVRSYTFVWPQTYATGSLAFVPLSR